MNVLIGDLTLPVGIILFALVLLAAVILSGAVTW
jgi:hypothetical protein